MNSELKQHYESVEKYNKCINEIENDIKNGNESHFRRSIHAHDFKYMYKYFIDYAIQYKQLNIVFTIFRMFNWREELEDISSHILLKSCENNFIEAVKYIYARLHMPFNDSQIHHIHIVYANGHYELLDYMLNFNITSVFLNMCSALFKFPEYDGVILYILHKYKNKIEPVLQQMMINIHNTCHPTNIYSFHYKILYYMLIHNLTIPDIYNEMTSNIFKGKEQASKILYETIDYNLGVNKKSKIELYDKNIIPIIISYQSYDEKHIYYNL